MYIDLSNANEAVGKIVYKTHNPKTLYLIESIKQVNPFDVLRRKRLTPLTTDRILYRH